MTEDLDPATAAAILIVQLQDLEELNDEKYNAPGTGDNDAAHALRVYHEELKRQVGRLRDHQIATRFGESPLGNEELPQMLPPLIPTFNAVRCESAEKECLTPSPDKDQPSEQSKAPPSPDMLSQGRSAMEEDRLSKKRRAAISPPLACKRRKISGSTLKDPTCTVCMDQSKWSEYVPLSCHHGYCLECVMRLFQRAMTDETLFPPQCCEMNIPLARVRSQVTTEFEAAFRERKIEMDTPASERTYCSYQACSTFLKSNADNLRINKIRCPKCNTRTCITCKAVAHESDYCPQDPAVVSLMATAASQGYKQCPSCHLLIELTFGCNHIT
ncbi:MAG: hypothetical protein Q9215_002748 [Flavoplaca cf. flavocitrina]